MKNELIDKKCEILFDVLSKHFNKKITKKYKFITSEFLNPQCIENFLDSYVFKGGDYEELTTALVYVCGHFYKYTFFKHILNKEKYSYKK